MAIPKCNEMYKEFLQCLSDGVPRICYNIYKHI